MRLNRGTLIILAVSLIVIVGALLITSNPSSQTAEASPTPAGGGPFFPDMTADSVVGFTVGENASDAFMRLARDDAESDWTISGSVDAETRELDLEAVAAAIDNVVALAAETQFEVENLAEFGLDEPAFTLEIDSGEAVDIVLVGNPNPGETRYYVQQRQVALGNEDTAEADNTVYLVMNSAVEALTNLVASPPFQPLPTATPSPTATLNPLSEVEQATATADALATATSIFATLAAEAEATAETTVEATAEPTAE